MEKAHKMQEKKKSISGRKTDKTGKPAIWQLRGRGFYAGNEKEEKNLQSVILDMVNRFGYLGILILIAVENVFPPIPSEVILTFGGFLTTCTRLHPAGVVRADSAAVRPGHHHGSDAVLIRRIGPNPLVLCVARCGRWRTAAQHGLRHGSRH